MQTREIYVKELIRRRYRRHAHDAGDWGGRGRAVRAGYDPDLLDGLDEAIVERWAGCGNVLAGAPLAEASVVVDLGAGSGLDALLASALGTPAPLVVTVDLTPELLAVAGAASDNNIVPIAGDFEQLPLADACCDLVIANAALNLALDQRTAFAEACRILRPGGRLHMCELVRDGDLPPELLCDPLAWSASLGGVPTEAELIEAMRLAGFEDIAVTDHRLFAPVIAVRVDAARPGDCRLQGETLQPSLMASRHATRTLSP
jgi:SAM-dependent methyltransferase